jgi:hypothetical protein
MEDGARFLLVGAHLREEDAAVAGVSALPAGDLWLSAVAIAARRNLAERDLVARVAMLRQELIAKEIFVAIRYGATASDAGAAQSKCAEHLVRWRALLERWRGRVEIVMRVGGAGIGARPDRAGFESGADYLRALHAMRHAVPIDAAFIADAESALRELADAVKTTSREDGSVEIAALVARDRIAGASSAAERLKERRPGVPFLLSGPWPLEVFADEG